MTDTISPPKTKIEIMSLAATMLGKQGFSQLDEGGAFARDASALFDLIVPAEIDSNRWRFCQEFQQISVFTTLTPSFDGWLYYFNKPSDVEMILYLDPAIDYLVFGDRVVTRTNQPLTMIYTKIVPVSKWPASFSMYITYLLASMLAVSVTNSDRMVARINADRELWHSRALFSDGQNSKSKRIQKNPYVDVRYKYRTRR